MSEAKERFNKFIGNENTDAETIIGQLEQRIKELEESQKQQSIIKLCERLDKSEQQNKELVDTLNYISDLSTKDGWIDSIISPVLEKYK